ncbi:MAG: hypothetical protein CM15mP81_05020 [Alphaproteobacteria bacterium]|nr:MAG: hypothetical protein CM15mP81_05020 [Alphaproteobacteria bacterium]
MPHPKRLKKVERFWRNPVGTGAFKFSSWKANEAVIVDKTQIIGMACKSDAIIFRPITDGNTRVAEMLSGGLDMMVEVPPVSLSGVFWKWFSMLNKLDLMFGS